MICIVANLHPSVLPPFDPSIHMEKPLVIALAGGLGDDAALWSHFALDAHGVRCLAYSRKSATLMEALARLRAVDSLMKVRPKWKCIDSMEKVRQKNLRRYYFHICHDLSWKMVRGCYAHQDWR